MEIIVFFAITSACTTYITFLLIDSKRSIPIFPIIRVTLDDEARHFIDKVKDDVEATTSYVSNSYKSLFTKLKRQSQVTSRKRVSAHLRKVVKQ